MPLAVGAAEQEAVQVAVQEASAPEAVKVALL